MAFFLAGFGLLLHILFWGGGLALLATPRRWRLGWPVLCAPAGLALQSAVVWVGAHGSFAGAQEYGRWALAIPLVLLGYAIWRRSLCEGRNLVRELARWWGVGLLVAGVLSALLLPFAKSSSELTSSSLGSCDAADYAAGARLFQEFSKDDRSGFLGLTEVVKLHSVDNFFEHFVRLNHFTPSAVVALNGSIFDLQPYQLVSLTTAVFLALSIPVVYWLSRAAFRYSAAESFWVAAVYGCSPLLWYAVYHTAMSQVLAAMAIALITAIGVAVWKSLSHTRADWAWAGLLAVAYWMLMGAYNFIVIVCWIPAVGYVGLAALESKQWRKLFWWAAVLFAPLLAVSLVFTERTLGLVERFVLFQEYDFGWKIPVLSPEGWFGIVKTTGLAAFPVPVRFAASVLLLGLAIYAVLNLRGRRGQKALICAATMPILIGYFFLQIRGALNGTNASYDAYKLFCVFYPGILAALAFWLTWARRGSAPVRILIATCAAVVVLANLWTDWRFVRRMRNPPLMVDRSILALRSLENVSQVDSLNLRITDFWARLWANSFLLRKPHFFPSYTYEGRRNTELKGKWDLTGGIATIHLSSQAKADELKLPAPYSVLNTAAPDYIRISLGEGWHEPEFICRNALRWQWTRGNASLVVHNPHTTPLSLALRLRVRSIVARDLQVWLNGQQIGLYEVGPEMSHLRQKGVTLPPGDSLLEFRSNVEPVSPGPQDRRRLGTAVFALELDVKALEK